MHFNFHLSGDESAEQTRRIANAVLALGGLTSATFESQTTTEHSGTHNLIAPEAFAEALRERTYVPSIADGAKWVEEDAITANVGESPIDEDPDGDVAFCNAAADDALAEPTVNYGVGVPVPPSHGFDSKGLPWDERIHSGSRKFNADGSWRYRKNVPDETKAVVEGELRGLVGLANLVEDDFINGDPASAVEPVGILITPPVPPAPPAPPLPPVVTHVALVEPSTLRDPNTVVSPPAPPATATRTYPDIVNLIMKHKITPETYVAIIGSDLPTFAATCKTDPNAASAAYDALDRASRT